MMRRAEGPPGWVRTPMKLEGHLGAQPVVLGTSKPESSNA